MAASSEFHDSPARSQYSERRYHRRHANGRGYNNHHKHHHDIELYLDSNSRSSGELADTELDPAPDRMTSRHYTLSPDSIDYDSNCGDLDSMSNDMHMNGADGVGAAGGIAENSAIDGIHNTDSTDYARLYTSMPVLEDGLSSGHASDTDNNNSNLSGKCLNNLAYSKKLYDILNGGLLRSASN